MRECSAKEAMPVHNATYFISFYHFLQESTIKIKTFITKILTEGGSTATHSKSISGWTLDRWTGSCLDTVKIFFDSDCDDVGKEKARLKRQCQCSCQLAASTAAAQHLSCSINCYSSTSQDKRS